MIAASGCHQMAVGKGAFGDNTAEILQWISK